MDVGRLRSLSTKYKRLWGKTRGDGEEQGWSVCAGEEQNGSVRLATATAVGG